ncbi:MAG: LamB/YcsF family protein [Candidatus Dormibacteria bacterium]
MDISIDAGEGHDDAGLAPAVTSLNVACGGHTGTPESMARAVDLAAEWGLRVGAHPAYPDPGSSGRGPGLLVGPALEGAVRSQVETLLEVADRVGFSVTHVKAHGSLYNHAWLDQGTATAIAQAVRSVDPGLLVFCPPDSAQTRACLLAGLRSLPEVFLDRAYAAAGTLMDRSVAGAVLADPAALPGQLERLLRIEFDTMCVHGDNPAAATLLAEFHRLAPGLGLVPAPYPL